MERDNWNNRYRYDNNRNQNRGSEGRVDEDSYRGAYRLDTTSDHRNQTTWDGFDRDDRNRNQGSDYNRNYNSDYNRNYNNDYNRNYNSGQQGSRRESSRDNDNDRNSRYQNQDRSGNNRNWDEQYGSTSGGYGSRFGGNSGGNFGGYDRQDRHDSVRSRIDERDQSGWSNFNTDYSPDNYAGRRDSNYGNTAGSLSYGYDGDRNSDPDWNRQYNPLSGERRSYHGNYQSRHPEGGQFRDSSSRNRNDDKANNWF
ncbi:hypothetical protein ACFS7Z_11520 [Pontibacter toksunensis]|uniref:SWFGD domain-containing protein n=1 Tax=Pontibacter toksunensis TaxID=1332631 RepID=A0ABW6BT89_9BACT